MKANTVNKSKGIVINSPTNRITPSSLRGK